MGLTLITGLANAGKTGLVVDRALEAAAREQTPHVVVPTIADARRLEDEFASKTPLGIRVSTFQALVEQLWALHGDGRRPIARATRSALVRHVVRAQADPLLAPVSGTPGFLRFLERAVGGSNPHRQAGPIPSTPAMARIVEIAAAYQGELDRAGLLEPSWIPILLAENSLKLEGPMMVVGIDNLPMSHAAMLIGLSRDNEVTVSLTWAESFVSTRLNDEIVSVLAAAASEHVHVDADRRDDELGRVADALFGPPSGLVSEGLIVTGVAAGDDGENYLVAKAVRRELDRGVPAGRIAVVCRDAGRRAHALEMALRAQGVRARTDIRRDVTATQLGRAFSSILSLVLGTGGRADATALLLGAYCQLKAEEVDALDKRWRKTRVADPSTLLSQIMETGGPLGAAVRSAREIGKSQLDSQSANKWQEVLDVLLSASPELSVGLCVERGALEDAAAHRAVLAAIGEMAITGGNPFTTADIAAALPSVRLAPFVAESSDLVQILDADAVGSRRFDVLVLFNLTATGFPVSDRESLEDEIERLLGGVPVSRMARTRSQFYSLVTRARSRLYLMRRSCSAEGESIAASPALDGLLDLYRGIGAGPDDAPASPPEQMEAPLGDIAVLAPVFGAGRREERISSLSTDLSIGERGSLASRIVLEGLRERETYSATEVEAYLQCPYRWFYERVLRPQDIDSGFDGRELGTRAHAYLATFYAQLSEQTGVGRVTASNLAASVELFERVSAAVGEGMALPASLDEELGAVRALAWSRQVVIDDAEMFLAATTVQSEVQFEDVAFAGAHFRGRIDRIDVGPDAVFVTDYKSSATVHGFAKFEAQGLIQAVVYSIAAEQHASQPVAASVYRSLRARRCRGFWRTDLLGTVPSRCSGRDAVDERVFKELVEQAEGRVANALEGMREGRVPRSPKAGACTFCSISSICQGGAL